MFNCAKWLGMLLIQPLYNSCVATTSTSSDPHQLLPCGQSPHVWTLWMCRPAAWRSSLLTSRTKRHFLVFWHHLKFHQKWKIISELSSGTSILIGGPPMNRRICLLEPSIRLSVVQHKVQNADVLFIICGVSSVTKINRRVCEHDPALLCRAECMQRHTHTHSRGRDAAHRPVISAAWQASDQKRSPSLSTKVLIGFLFNGIAVKKAVKEYY